ncbi:hypothetical protein PV646_32120 [Streptomyces sp. ID05-26A]|nr:hypothetical protein [Streptomyces sp. ID05-26A]
MKYFVIQDGGPAPLALVRTDGDREQKLAGTGEWADSALLAAPEPGWTVTETAAHEFYDHVYEAMREARAGLPCVAVLSSTYRVDEFVTVTAVLRRRDGVEEWLGRDNVWQPGDPGGTIRLPISEEELGRHQWTAARPSWFVLHESNDRVRAVVRKIPSAEEAFTRELRWEPSDLLGRTGLRVEEVHEYAAKDARMAIEVAVRGRRHRGLTRYFALWDGKESEPRYLHSVIRRTALGAEEVHTGRGGWQPTRVLRRLEDTLLKALPVSEEEAGVIIAAEPARRCFRVLSVEGPHLPFAVVRVDGEHEEAFTRDLVWGPSTLLADVREHRGRWVEELSPGESADHAAYRLALAQRRLWQSHEWQGPRYHAIFTDICQALELTNAIALVEGDTWEEYVYRRGEWTRCSLLRGVSNGGNTYEELPISPDEARRLMELLDAR